METTTKKFAEKHGVVYAVAAGVLKFLEGKGLVKVVGVKPNPAGRGKGSTIYDVPDELTLTL